MTFLKKYTVNLLLLTLIISISALIAYFVSPQMIHRHFAVILLLVAGIHYLSFYTIATKGVEKFNRFINFTMIFSMGKMLFVAAIIAAYGLILKKEILLFTITIMLLYVIFLIFDVLWLLKLNKFLIQNTKK
jgi:hypothetical protein